MKLTPLQMVAIWNKVNWMFDMVDDPRFTGWAKRLVAYMQPEITIWNSLTGEEREDVKSQKLSFPVQKIKAECLPGFLTDEDADILKPVVDGDIKTLQPQLKKDVKETKHSD